MKCKYCGYRWKEKKENPVSCPKCKRRFDYEKTSQDNRKTDNQEE